MRREAELRDRRSQAELGSERNLESLTYGTGTTRKRVVNLVGSRCAPQEVAGLSGQGSGEHGGKQGAGVAGRGERGDGSPDAPGAAGDRPRLRPDLGQRPSGRAGAG